MRPQPKQQLNIEPAYHGQLVKVAAYRVMEVAQRWRVLFICLDGVPYLSCEEFDTAFDAGCFAAQGKLSGFRVA